MGKPAIKLKPQKTLLDEAIEQYKIPAWPYEPGFDRIVVFSVPEDRAARETYSKNSTIIKPQTRQVFDKAETPRGVLCAAGLGARDVLRSHGIDLGHMLWVARLSPWRHEVETDADGKPIEFLFMRVGDIVGSETLQKYVQEGRAHVEVDTEGRHRMKFDDEALRPRFDPPSYLA